jgi:large subunit ribosomal protein L2
MLKLYKFIFTKFIKIFTLGYVLASGRNFTGRICVRHQGGGVKANYLKIDRFRYLNQFGFVFRVIKDLYRTGYVGLVIYENGLTAFILLSEGLVRGTKFFSGYLKLYEDSIKLGSTQKLLNINLFETISAIELFPFSGIKVARAAGCSSKIIAKDNVKSLLKLSSGWLMRVSNQALGTFGVISNIAYIYKTIHKAGNSRRLGIRPTVRGVIQNPCDHPHGGGEGRGSPPAAQVSP